MSKPKKKRNKPYTGAGSNATRPQTIRIEAVKRSKLQQWWLDRKRVVKPVAITTLVVTLLAYFVYELLRLVFGG